jgi:hypothetical protein
MDDIELLDLRANLDHVLDARGRMTSTNEPRADARRPAPRAVVACTRGGYIVRIGAAVADDTAARLVEAIGLQPPRGEPRVPLETAAAVREVLGPVEGELAGPAYRFPESFAYPIETVELTPSNIELARETFPWLYTELADWAPCFAVVRDGAAASVCFTSRVGERAAEAGVETKSAFRGRRFAVAATLAWGAAIHAAGKFPIYSTSWTNLSSMAVARHAKLMQFGADASFD